MWEEDGAPLLAVCYIACEYAQPRTRLEDILQYSAHWCTYQYSYVALVRAFESRYKVFCPVLNLLGEGGINLRASYCYSPL
jgi:hypothetical protein